MYCRPFAYSPAQERNHFISDFRSAGHWPGERSLGCWSACCKLQQRGVTDVSKGRGNWRLGLLLFWGQNPWWSWFGVHLAGGLWFGTFFIFCILGRIIPTFSEGLKPPTSHGWSCLSSFSLNTWGSLAIHGPKHMTWEHSPLGCRKIPRSGQWSLCPKSSRWIAGFHFLGLSWDRNGVQQP